MRISPSEYGRQYKAALAITDVRPTARDEIVEVDLAITGKSMRLRRDMVEFWPGRVVVPFWLYQKLLNQ